MLKSVNLIVCKNCGKDVLPHIACKACGFYNGKNIKGTKQVVVKTV